MALSPVYAAILQDLNKAVAVSQPEDVLQFCANWFNAKLEEQRIAGRASIAQAEAAAGRSKSLSSPFGAGIPGNALRKKGSLPSLASGGYSFGASSPTSPVGGGAIPPVPAVPRDMLPEANMQHQYNLGLNVSSAGPSPYSEIPPVLRLSSTSAARPASGSGATNGNPSSSTPTSGISWNRSFGASGGGLPPAPSSATLPPNSAGGYIGNDMHDSDEETRPSSADRPSSGVNGSGSRDRMSTLPTGGARTDNGIPAGYNLGRRTSVSAESIDPSASSVPLPKTIIPKTSSQRSRIETSIEKNLLFRNLDEEQHADVLNAMKEVKVAKGTEVIVQGAVGDFFYVVESGEFQVWVRAASAQSGTIVSPASATAPGGLRSRSMSPGVAGDPESQRDDTTTVHGESDGSVRSDGSKLVATIGPGGSFGELALMYNAPRAATVVCNSPNALVWALDRVTFRTILMEHTHKKRRMYEQFLAEVPILVSLEGHERSKIADALEERVYEEGEDVVREGELGKNFYIIESGRAEVLKKKSDGRLERVGTLSKGDYFGELALLNSAPRAATVRPLPGSGRLRVATLGEKAFTRLLGPVVEILTRRAERNYGISASSSATPTRSSAELSRGEAGRHSMASPHNTGYKNEELPPPGSGARGHTPVSPRRRSSRPEAGRRTVERDDIVMAD